MSDRCGQGAFVRLLALVAVAVVAAVMWWLVSGWAD